MIENWEDLFGKRILLEQKHLSTISIIEATVVEVSESGKYVKFQWQSGSESWEVPEDEYNFGYDKILEVLEQSKEKQSEKDQTIHIALSEEIPEIGGIYETLKPNECYLITKKCDSVLVASNKDGKTELEWVSVTNEDKHTFLPAPIAVALSEMLNKQKGKGRPIKEKEPDIASNPLTGRIESHDDNTSSPKPKVDISSIKYKIDNF